MLCNTVADGTKRNDQPLSTNRTEKSQSSQYIKKRSSNIPTFTAASFRMNKAQPVRKVANGLNFRACSPTSGSAIWFTAQLERFSHPPAKSITFRSSARQITGLHAPTRELSGWSMKAVMLLIAPGKTTVSLLSNHVYL